jgi:fucose permease
MGVLYGVVAKCTTNENRAKAFLYFEGLYSIGVVCGPMVGSVLTFNLNIFGKSLILHKASFANFIVEEMCLFQHQFNLLVEIVLDRSIA